MTLMIKIKISCLHAYRQTEGRAGLWGYLLGTGLSLICMVLSSWLFVLGKLKLLFFLWRREQHELSPCGDEDSEDVREPDLFITEISMQFDWNVCSSTNSWFCRGRRRECCLWITLLHHWLALLNSEWRRFAVKTKQTEQSPQRDCLIIGKWIIEGIEIYWPRCLY